MKKTYSQNSVQFSVLAIALLFGVSAAARSAYGQVGGQARDMSTAEHNVRALEMRKEPAKDSKTLMAEVNEDFERLRADDERIKNASSPDTALNFLTVMETSVDIKKCGARLRENLAGLPKPEDENKEAKPDIPRDQVGMKSLLASLHTTMTRFLGNPVFSDMGTLDNQLARQARRDLNSLIELNEAVRKAADKLGKRAGR